MFGNLSKGLTKVINALSRKSFIDEEDLNVAMREIRIALLEADVSLAVVRAFIDKVKEKAVGQQVIRSVSPGQMIVKIVNDELVETLGKEHAELKLVKPLSKIMMVGLQGSGKTTTSAKLALKLKDKLHKKILLVSLDVQRPAAQEQLEFLAKQIEVASFEILKGVSPLDIAKKAIKQAEINGFDVVIFDTAGRLHIDEQLMQELKEIRHIVNPDETLLVADSMTGQDAVNIADHFNKDLNLTGIVLTRIDGDSRGGAALSMRFVTGCPIKFMGVGERVTDLEDFHPERIASRILDMGDVVSLVEKAAEIVDQEDAEKMMKKLEKGKFDLNDLLSQIRNIKKLGGISSIISMLPGIGKLKSKIMGDEDGAKLITRQEAIILSMTLKERRNPKILNASRKIRIANGSGVKVHDVNKLIKQYMDMSNMIKKFSKMDKKSLLKNGLGIK